MSEGKGKRILATTAVVGAIIGIMATGDSLNINRELRNGAAAVFPRLENVVVAENFYQKPYELSIVTEKNENGQVESYLSTSDRKYPIYQGQEGALVGSLDDISDNMTAEQKKGIFFEFNEPEQNEIVLSYMKDKVGDGIEDGKNFLKDLYDRIKGYFENP
ncbi:MAG: hypothetical protein NTV63_00810 [Candidatus Woesearchaeota archaeon]|nr:hypothetical protein [Candidatus Woesearchaeota archaeon]